MLRADETVIYTNSAGFLTLADWMVFLSTTSPDDMCDLHMNWHLNSFIGKRTATLDTVWFIDERTDAGSPSTAHDREVTFMMLPEDKLEELKRKAGPSA